MQPNKEPVGELKTNGPSPGAVAAEAPDRHVDGGPIILLISAYD